MSSIFNKVLNKGYRLFVLNPLSKVDFFTNKLHKKKQCYICKASFNHFTTFKGGSKAKPEFFKRINIIGSDPDNFKCMYCKANDRERHLFMFFDKLGLWERFRSSAILHFAPEKNLSKKITSLLPSKYVKADFYPKDKSIQKIDATQIPYPGASFDVLICNHVLEHISDYNLAMREFFRILKPNGIAILQTPYSTQLTNNFEVKDVNTDEARNFFYRQRDHVRIFSEEVFLNSLLGAGFKLDIIKNSDLFDDKTCQYYGVNKKEDLIKVIKLMT